MRVHNADSWTLIEGECVSVLKKFSDSRFDSVVCDPPYELGFMGKAWDATGIAYSVELWREVLRVLKPGGHLLAFGGTRTYHRMACAIEDAGFEIRDSLHWMYGTGFPKSLNVGKAIDATERFGGSGSQQLRERSGLAVGTVGTNMNKHRSGKNDVETTRLVPPCVCGHAGQWHDPDCAFEGCSCQHWKEQGMTAAAAQWEGWGTALKPAHEPIVMARKPLIGTVAANVQAHGTGALNIDGCRIESADASTTGRAKSGGKGNGGVFGDSVTYDSQAHAGGRWPANVLLDESAAEELDAQSGTLKSGGGDKGNKRADGSELFGFKSHTHESREHVPDTGGASRFFYVAKPSRKERDQGCEHLTPKTGGEATDREDGSAGVDNPRAGAGRTGGAKNFHPTVKPVELMRYLVRLVTPPGGTVLDPFAGSGTTGMAARLEDLRFVGIEREPDHFGIAVARVGGAK